MGRGGLGCLVTGCDGERALYNVGDPTKSERKVGGAGWREFGRAVGLWVMRGKQWRLGRGGVVIADVVARLWGEWVHR